MEFAYLARPDQALMPLALQAGTIRTWWHALWQGIWRYPLWRFLLYGVALHLLISHTTHASPEPLLVDGQIEQLRISWIRQTGGEPNERELRLLLRQAINEELLFRSALDQGLHLIDPLSRRRLVRNMRFLGEEGDAAELLRRALGMGMHLEDILVRRRLLQLMEFAARARVAAVSDRELQAYYHERSLALRRLRISFEHRFFSAERRGAKAAKQVAKQLTAVCAATAELPQDGDVFDAGESFLAQSRAKLGKHFGFAFADAILDAPVERCLGPVASSYGSHVVWVSARTEDTPPLEEVRKLLSEELMEQRTREQIQQEVTQLRAQHPMDSLEASY